MTHPLTDLSIKKLTPGATRRTVRDGKIPSLFLIVQPSGARSWAYHYRRDGQPRKITFGSYPAITLEEARRLAQKAAGQIADGKDPAADKREAKATAKQARLAEKQADRDTIEAVFEKFITRYAKRRTRETSWRETERILNREVIERWKGRRLSQITRADVRDVLNEIVDRGAPIIANRTLAAFRRLCNWAVEEEIIERSPCERVKAPAPEHSRDRVLSDDELRMVWKGCDAVGWPFGSLFQVLILTGQRRGEVAEMRWSELDLDARTWELPKERTKNGHAHTVPMADAVMRILAAAPRIKGADAVFTLTGNAVSGFERAKARVDRFIEANNGQGTPAHWTLHDARRTFASGCARLGIAIHVIEAVLNHKSGSIRGAHASTIVIHTPPKCARRLMPGRAMSRHSSAASLRLPRSLSSEADCRSFATAQESRWDFHHDLLMCHPHISPSPVTVIFDRMNEAIKMSAPEVTGRKVAHSKAAALRDVSGRTLDRWAAAGIIPKPTKINRRKYHDLEAVLAAGEAALPKQEAAE
jgi:integrase